MNHFCLIYASIGFKVAIKPAHYLLTFEVSKSKKTMKNKIQLITGAFKGLALSLLKKMTMARNQVSAGFKKAHTTYLYDYFTSIKQLIK